MNSNALTPTFSQNTSPSSSFTLGNNTSKDPVYPAYPTALPAISNTSSASLFPNYSAMTSSPAHRAFDSLPVSPSPSPYSELQPLSPLNAHVALFQSPGRSQTSTPNPDGSYKADDSMNDIYTIENKMNSSQLHSPRLQNGWRSPSLGVPNSPHPKGQTKKLTFSSITHIHSGSERPESMDIANLMKNGMSPMSQRTNFSDHNSSKRNSLQIASGRTSAVPDQRREGSNEDVNNVTVRTGLCKLANLSTKRGRRNHALMIMLVSVIPVFALLIQNSVNVYKSKEELNIHEEVKAEIDFSIQTGNVIHFTQIERGKTALFVSSDGDQNVYQSLLGDYENTDAAIKSLKRWNTEPNLPHFDSADAYHNRLIDFRKNLYHDGQITKTVPEVIQFYSDDNAVILRWVGKSIQFSKSGDLWKTLVGYYMLILSKEQAGIERALGSTFYAQGGFDAKQMVAYLERRLIGKTYLDRCQEYSTTVSDFLNAEFNNKETNLNLIRMRNEIMENNLTDSDVQMGTYWFANMTSYINVLKRTQDTLAQEVVQGLAEEVKKLNDVLLESVFVIVLPMVLFPLVFMAAYRLTHRIQSYAQTLQERTRELDTERKRSETLLFELLPVSVAMKLLNNEHVPPVSYGAVTVFFSDIVGFTAICSRSTPMQVIDMLNSLYRCFDDIIIQYDVYKVETIGDAYMVASGLPQVNIDGHATEMAGMALDVLKSISAMTVSHLQGEKLRMRIGLNSGQVVAGVVGHKMPRYCLFGDTVNVASRMESTSLPLMIQITKTTKHELDCRGGFVIKPRGEVEIKGKGRMFTYWLISRATTDPSLMSTLGSDVDMSSQRSTPVY